MSKRYSILFLFLFLQINLPAEELPWFSLDCNLRNANLIVQAEIIDKKGTLKIEKYLKGDPVKKDRISIEAFAIDKKERRTSSFPKAKGKKVLVFLVLGKDQEIEPSFWGWELSTLWIEEGKYMGVMQLDNPGGYTLVPWYENFEVLKGPIDNWLFLEDQIEAVENIPTSTQRLTYLTQLFDWHPFKEDILMKISEEEVIPGKYMQELVWKFFRYDYLTQSDIYECGWMDYDQENYYQITFRLYKRSWKDNYDRQVKKVISSFKSAIDYMEGRTSEDTNESFLLEFLDFLEVHPTKDWTTEKAEIKSIIKKNEPFYNRQFLGQLRRRMEG